MTQLDRTRLSKIGNLIGPPRFLLFLAILAVAFLGERLLQGGSGLADWADGAAMAFDLAAALFLISLAPLVRYADAKAMRAHAAENDANRHFILVLTTLIMLTVLAAIGAEMPGSRDGDLAAIGKLVGTLLLVWLFANSVYALHYAHAFYARDKATGADAGGIEFPGTATPTYADFAYFAFTLGMTFQTSDVAVSSPRIRRAVLLHCFGAFVFNIGVIAFAINVLGGSA